MSIQERIEKSEFENLYTPIEKGDSPEVRKEKHLKNLQAQYKAENDFKEACREEFGISKDNSKWNRCFEIGWDLGHSAGYHEVYGYLIDLVDLIK